MLFSFYFSAKGTSSVCVCVGCKGISFKSFKIVFAFLLKRSLLYQQIKLVLCIGTRSRMYKAKLALTLKAPKKKKKKKKKTASENVVCLCRLLNILADFSNLFLHTGKQYGPRSDCS